MIALRPRVSPEDYFAGFLSGLRAARLVTEGKKSLAKIDKLISTHETILKTLGEPAEEGPKIDPVPSKN